MACYYVNFHRALDELRKNYPRSAEELKKRVEIMLDLYWYGDYEMIANCDLCDKMKSTHHFRDQLSVISSWFDQWNDCEQTVALYSLVKKLGPAHARFIAMVLDQTFSQCVELSIQEQQANDPAFISSLSSESKEVAVAQLLSHLPLLHPGNEEAKTQYLGLIPKILAHSIRHSMHIEESRQLLSYSLIHPAISNEDRRSLTLWLRQLEDRIHNYAVYPPVIPYGITNGSLPNAPNGSSVQQSSDGFNSCQYNTLNPQMDLWRPGPLMGLNGNPAVDMNGCSVMNGLGSNSLPPGVGSHHMMLHALNSAPSNGTSSHPDGTHTLPSAHSRIRRSNSLSPPCNISMKNNHSPSSPDWSREDNGNSNENPNKSDHAPLSPQSSVASSGSGSESQKDDKDIFNQEGSGMKDVPSWLKSLRLHKYCYVFKNMTYEEMMSITEDKLEKMNITKGARHKIVLSIQKLRQRQETLRCLEKDIQDGSGSVRTALNEMKVMLQTPVKTFNLSCSDSQTDSCMESNSPESDLDSQQHIHSGNEPDPTAVVSEGDIPGQMTRLMGKICSTLLITPQEEENHNYFIMLIDKCLSHEAFTPLQKRRLFSWKQQIQKVCHPLPPRRSLDRQNKGKWTNFNHNGNSAQHTEYSAPTNGPGSLRRRVPVQYQQQQQPHRVPLAHSNLTEYSAQPIQRNSLSTVIKRPSLQDHMKPHVNVQRTNSAPVRPNPLPTSVFDKGLDGANDSSNDPELNIRLESLCLSVTEHAIGSFDGAVPLF